MASFERCDVCDCEKVVIRYQDKFLVQMNEAMARLDLCKACLRALVTWCNGAARMVPVNQEAEAELDKDPPA